MNEETIKAALLAELAELDELDRGAAESRRPVELDQTTQGRLSRMDAMQGQAMALATQERRRQRRLRIQAALKRLDAGDYGYCVVCDEEIGEKRLETDLTVPTCVDCAK